MGIGALYVSAQVHDDRDALSDNQLKWFAAATAGTARLAASPHPHPLASRSLTQRSRTRRFGFTAPPGDFPARLEVQWKRVPL